MCKIHNNWTFEAVVVSRLFALCKSLLLSLEDEREVLPLPHLANEVLPAFAAVLPLLCSENVTGGQVRGGLRILLRLPASELRDVESVGTQSLGGSDITEPV